MSTFGAIQTQVQNILGRSDTNTNTQIMAAANVVQKLLAANGDWEDLEQINSSLALVSGTDEYVLRTWLSDTAFMKLVMIQLWDGTRWREPMRAVTPLRWDKEIETCHHTTTDKPVLYRIWKRTLKLHPKPDDDYTVRCRWFNKPAEITSTSDNMAYDDMYDPMITYAIAGFVWAHLEELQLAHQMMGMADSFVKTFEAFNNKIFNFSAFVSAKMSEPRSVGDPWANPFVNQLSGG